MASERIKVTKVFLSENKLPNSLRRMALGNCHYLAARLAFFDPKIKARSLLIRAFRYRLGWPEEAKLYVVLYLLLMPVSSIILKPFSKRITNAISYK